MSVRPIVVYQRDSFQVAPTDLHKQCHVLMPLVLIKITKKMKILVKGLNNYSKITNSLIAHLLPASPNC